MVVKYRKSLLSGVIVNTLKQSINQLTQRSEFTVSEMEADRDHLHVMIDLLPNYSISQVVRRLKQQTTIDLWQAHSTFLRMHFWKEKTFWSDGYFASSVGNASVDTIRHYIQNQG